MQTATTPRTAVIGGGLAGLAAAITAADRGAEVTLVDARSDLGGRARTHRDAGFSFNLGPHALYRAGATAAWLDRVGIRAVGRMPNLANLDIAVDGELRRAKHPSALGRDGLRLARAALGRQAIERAAGRSMAEWIADELPEGRARQAAEALTRLTSYASELDHADAAAHLEQIRRASRGVLYIHGGWSTVVAAVTGLAEQRGVRIERGHKVGAVHRTEAGLAVTTDDGTTTFDTVVIAAGGPNHVAGLLNGASPTIERWAARARPVTAACLDVALSRLPSRRHTAIIGIDEPTYCIVHSLAARLAPPGGAMIHVMRYGDTGDDPSTARASLEAQLDRAQPGWRHVVVEARLSRRLVVAHDVARVAPEDRPREAVEDLPGVFVAGDWITTDGLLADAAVASGVRAGHLAAMTPSGVGLRHPGATSRG